MAIGVRDSNENVTGGRKLYTGATFVKVVAINPTVQEMHAQLGFEEPKAPTPYVDKDDTGNDRIRIDVWVKNDDILQKEAFFIARKDVTSSSGKVQFVNNYAQFCYADPQEGPQYEWFSKEGLRKAYNGEEQFIEFVRAWVNHKGGKKGEQLYFDNWNALFTGNFNELKQLVSLTNDPSKPAPNMVGVLMGVRKVDVEGTERMYQSMYRRKFVRTYQSLSVEFQKALAEEYGEFKSDYQKDLTWKEYDPSAITVPTGAESPSTATTPWM
jgi:hypothetical protein